MSDQDDEFQEPEPKNNSQDVEKAIISRIDTSRRKKPKELPEDEEHEGLQAKTERKRVRAEDAVGSELAPFLFGDEKFEQDAVEAARQHSIKRRKKYRYTGDGIPIEPFSVREEEENRIFDSTIVKDTKKDGSWDPWLLSVEDELQELDKKKAMKDALEAEDSLAESEDEDKGNENEEEEDKDEPKEQVPEETKLELLEKICNILQSKESVSKALVRLKGKGQKNQVQFKKNIRKKTKIEEKKEENNIQEGDPVQFQALMELADKALNIGYIGNLYDHSIDVYTDPKEGIEFEAKQLKALIERKNKPKE